MSQHWYTHAGEACHFIGDRATTLRDARQLFLVPSISTVLDELAKQALIPWMIGNAVRATQEAPRVIGETMEDFCKRMVVAARKPAQDAAHEGSLIHDAIEASFKGTPYPAFYEKHVLAVREKLAEEYPDVDDWTAEECFAHHEGFGGMIDLHSKKHEIIVDFKSKDGDFSDKKQLIYDQNWQLGGYKRGRKFTNAERYANIFVSRTHPGAVKLHRWKAEDILQGEKVFVAALALWIAVKKYDPSWEIENECASAGN